MTRVIVRRIGMILMGAVAFVGFITTVDTPPVQAKTDCLEREECRALKQELRDIRRQGREIKREMRDLRQQLQDLPQNSPDRESLRQKLQGLRDELKALRRQSRPIRETLKEGCRRCHAPDDGSGA